MKLYFGYGSNLDFDDWSNWCSKRSANPNGLIEHKRAFLPGFSINYSHYSVTREGGAANLFENERELCGTYGVLFKVENPFEVEQYLKDQNIFIRNRTEVKNLEGYLRVTLGNQEQMTEFTSALANVL